MCVSKLTWIIFGAIVVGVLATLVIVSRGASPQVDVSAVDAKAIQKPSEFNGQIGDRVLGNANTKVVLIEYGDFQCPACAAAHPGLKTIMNEYGNSVALVYRNFPLTNIHPNAKAAAAAAESAGQQGKYWEMHDLIYEGIDNWGNLTGADRTSLFAEYAKSLGLDETQFKADLESEAVGLKIAFDQAIAKKIGVKSTPTFYLNGTIIDSEIIKNVQQSTGNSLRDLLDSELKKAGVAPPVR